MEDLSLHILDIVENSIDAAADKIDIAIMDSSGEDLFVLSIRDNGMGMNAETLEKITDPFFTTKSVRSFGLGIPLLKQAAEECNGSFSISSSPGKGTCTKVTFQSSHIDRKPLGNLGASMMVLISGHPEIDFSLTYVRDALFYRFDTAALKETLEGVPINLPEVLKLIRDDINEGIHGTY